LISVNITFSDSFSTN